MQRIYDQEHTKAVVDAQIHGAFLSESAEQSRRFDSPDRVLVAQWKGMTPEQRASILAEQERQREQHRLEAQQKAADQRNYDAQLAQQDRVNTLLHRNEMRQKNEQAAKLAEENRILAEQQKRK